MNKKQVRKFLNKNKFQIISGIVVLIVVFAFLIQRGETGAHITLHIPSARTQIILDDDLYATTRKNNEVVRIDTSPGEHAVATTKSGYYPWAKEIELKRGESLEFNVFNISTTTARQEIKEAHPNFSDLQNLLSQYTPPTKESPLTSESGNVNIFVDDKFEIVAEAKSDPSGIFCLDEKCIKDFVVIERERPVEFLSFLPGFESVLIFKDSDGAFVLEIAREGIQNAQPLDIEKGGKILESNDSFYFFEDGRFFQVNLY